jgi:hypothetical protein
VATSDDDPLIEAWIGHGLAEALDGPGWHRQLHFKSGGHYLQKHAAIPIAAHMAMMMGLRVGGREVA